MRAHDALLRRNFAEGRIEGFATVGALAERAAALAHSIGANSCVFHLLGSGTMPGSVQ